MPRDAKDLKKPEPKYIVKHEGPNRAQRRAMRAAMIGILRKQDTWKRQLIRAGIDPNKVLLQRAVRKSMQERAEKLKREQEKAADSWLTEETPDAPPNDGWLSEPPEEESA